MHTVAEPPHFAWWPLLVFFALTGSVGGLGYWFFEHQIAANTAEIHTNLTSVGELKAGQIGAFLTERRGDARALSAQISRELAPGWWQRSSSEPPLTVQQHIASVATAYGYTGVLLLDTHGEIRYSIDGSTGLTGAGKALAMRALHDPVPVFSQIYFADPAAPTRAMLDTFAPVLAPDGSTPTGILVLRGTWSFLFTLVQTWPVESVTAETALVRKDGADVLFMNDLRFQTGNTLSLRFPLNTPSDSPAWPAIRAVQGRYGMLDSIDYRGQRVFAYALPVPHSDWSLVVKVDADERLASIRRLQLISASLALLFIALVSGALGLWQRARRRAQDSLRTSEARYHSVVAALAEGIVLNARDGAIIACNASAERILGLSADQMRGRMPMDPRWYAIHEDGSAFPGDSHPGSVTLRTGNPQTDVVMGVHKPDGTLTWISINSVPIFHLAEPTPSAVVASFVDITARKQAEQALRVSEQRLKEAQRIGKLGSVDWDLTTNTLLLSDEALVIYGLDKNKNEVDLEELVKLVHPEDAKRVGQSLQAAVAGTARHDLEHRMVRPDGRVIYVRATAELFLDSHGKPARMIGAVLDITERTLAENALKRVNEALEQRVLERTASLLAAKQEAERANNAKSAFLSNMSHELRTPMNAILGFSQLIDTDTVTPLTPDHKECVREILHAGDHLLHLINEVLDLAHVESGRMNFSIEPVALTPLIRDCIALMRPLVNKNQLQLTLAENSSTLDMVQSDRHRVRQVILNLLSNAVKYNRPGGRVIIGCAPAAADAIRLSVQDTGVGISAENMPRLFKTFERLEADRYRVDGTGIGLALCKQMIEKMGGRIGVDSTADIGSTFWIELPAAAQLNTPVKATQQPAAEHPAYPVMHRVLYVEDHPANLRLMQKFFSTLPNVALLDAHTGELGIELAIGHRPALILLDITLPGMDGYEVLRRLREHAATRNIPVVAVTANATPTDIKRGKEAGFDDYLAKPFDVQKLLTVISRLLAEVQRDQSAIA